MNKLTIIKETMSAAVSVGVGAIAGTFIKNNSPKNMHMLTKICVGVGGFILTALASDAASKYTETTIDKTLETVKSVVNEIDEAKNEST